MAKNMKNTPVDVQAYTYEDIGRNQSSICISVWGFWSYDTIRVYAQRAFSDKGVWKFTISQSSGGRDTEEVLKDSDAMRNYALALNAAADVVDDLEWNVGLIEAGYQAYREELRLAQEAKKAAEQAAIDADPAMGLGNAKRILGTAIIDVETLGGIKTILAYRRGTDKIVKLTVDRFRKLVIKYGDSRISKADAFELLADCSVREVTNT